MKSIFLILLLSSSFMVFGKEISNHQNESEFLDAIVLMPEDSLKWHKEQIKFNNTEISKIQNIIEELYLKHQKSGVLNEPFYISAKSRNKNVWIKNNNGLVKVEKGQLIELLYFDGINLSVKVMNEEGNLVQYQLMHDKKKIDQFIDESNEVGLISKEISNLRGDEIKLKETIYFLEKEMTAILENNKFESIKRSFGDSSIFITTPKKGVYLSEGKHSSAGKFKEITFGDALRIVKIILPDMFRTIDVGSTFYRLVYAQDIIISNELATHIENIKKSKEQEIIKKQNAENRARKEKHKSALIQLYGSYDAQRILNHQYWLGMTANMAKSSWGTPDDINRTVNTFGISEQWVYRSRDVYLYFKDGVLTSFQD